MKVLIGYVSINFMMTGSKINAALIYFEIIYRALDSV